LCALAPAQEPRRGARAAPAPARESGPAHGASSGHEAEDPGAHEHAAHGPDRHLVDLLDRYVWIVPTAAGHRVSLGAACLLLLALVLQFAAKMVDLEERTFGRCTALATTIFATLSL